jgi:hypothetical protein
MPQFIPPDHTKGDESTIGGYASVHGRPAAFEGSDGFSYSVEIMSEETGDATGPWAAFFLFVKWARLGAQAPEGHLESDYLVTAQNEAEARRGLGEMPLDEVKNILDALIAERHGGEPRRKWWDVMKDEGNGNGAPE